MITESNPMKTVAILSQKGGSGKTTTALHMAVAAFQADQSAVVIDLDPQGSAATWFEARKRARHTAEPIVMPAHPAQLEAILDNLRGQEADWVFIDTAPQSDSVAVKAAELADIVIITCKPSVMDLRAIQSTLRLTQIAGVKPYVLLTQTEAQGTRHKEAAATLGNLDVSVIPFQTTKRVAYMDSLIDGQTASEFEPLGRAAEETREIFGHVKKLAQTSQRVRAA